jgi:single-stranded-DNA-specific exonuclease
MHLARSKWIVATTPDQEIVTPLVEALNIPEALAALLVQRGFDSIDGARTYLKPSLDTLSDPLGLKDMDKAVALIGQAVRGGRRIMVHGDYDVDGQCATTLLTRVLREAGADVIPFVPHRVRDGYDFGPAGLKHAEEQGVDLILTCDCGSTAVDTVTAAREKGIKVVVTDHHLTRVVAPADAVVNPQQGGCTFPHKELCGTGIAFKLAQALVADLDLPPHLHTHMLDLVALATVADVVPLVGENRTLVRYGLKLLGESRWPGLRALIKVTQVRAPIRAGQVGFILAPRLNAVGRIGSAMDGVRLLLSDDSGEAHELAIELESVNARRQALDATVLGEALDVMEKDVDLEGEYGLVLAHDGWHPGVIGLVASRVVERVHRPVIVIGLDGDEGKGSGRSISAFDLHAALIECGDLLERYGGHKMAAGLTVRRDRIDAFREQFNAVAKDQLTADDLVPRQRVDAVVSIDLLNDELERLLARFEPCGQGNPAPVLAVQNVGVRRAMPVGSNHLRFTIDDGRGSLGMIAFGWGDRVPDGWWKQPVDVALKLERNEYRGVSSLQGRVMDIQLPN